MGFFGWLQLALIVLKLCGVIAWPWLYVLAPGLACVVLMYGILFLAAWAKARETSEVDRILRDIKSRR